MLFIPQISFPQASWLQKESENFIIIYKPHHAYLADYLISSAEKSYSKLTGIFGSKPSERIVLNTFDLYDYGFGEATSIPQNYIHIEIEPFEAGYENIPYNERFQWVINHELVHIFYNDQANSTERGMRSVFSKTAPEQSQPVTSLFTILTNYNRFSPVWHQESIAVYLETWLSGGFGRVLGSFDEMYFRSLVLENKELLSLSGISSRIPVNSFLMDMEYYLYGTRFGAFLAAKYGNEKFLEWYRTSGEAFYNSYRNRFEEIFGLAIGDVWRDFTDAEIEFQEKNIARLMSEKVTQIKYLSAIPLGWVSTPYFSPEKGEILFAYQRKDHLASIGALNLKSMEFKDLETLPTPGMSQVSSTAFDPANGIFYFTTNNNQLFRDLNALNINTGKVSPVMEDERTGNITLDWTNKTIWGVRHNAGEVSVVYSKPPYKEFLILRSFPVGEEIYNLAVSPNGRQLAAVMHKTSGEQSLLIVDLENLQNVTPVYSAGNPENPSWSSDGKRIYFNAAVNGVSNIFLYSLEEKSCRAVSHSIKGLFRPLEINDDTLFAFEFSSEGFMPVLFKSGLINRLPAIEYLGQSVVDKNEKIKDYLVEVALPDSNMELKEEEYSGIGNIKVQSFVPVVSGFQSSVVAGIFSRIADPLLYHDFSIEAGYTVKSENNLLPKYHLRAKYEYKKEFSLGINYNAPDFYDLFNKRKRGLAGEKYYIGSQHYLIYDNPLKMKLTNEIALYRGIERFTDNLIPVSQPDFAVAQSNFNIRNYRRSIGSSEFEYGDEFDLSAVFFASTWDKPQYSAQIFGGWNKLLNWIAPHNTLSLRINAGYLFKNDNHLQSRFFIGGFGNREVENADVKQFRKPFMFPGIAVYDLVCDEFVRFTIENILPPLKLEGANIGSHYLNYIELSLFSQSLISNSNSGKYWINGGGQINFVFNHWFNYETTLSLGAAKAFSEGKNEFDWFISIKLLKN